MKKLNELKRLNMKLYALIDSEKSSSSDHLEQRREEFRKNCKNINIDLHILHNRAFENCFAKEALQKAFGSNYDKLNDFDKLENHKPGCGQKPTIGKLQDR